MLRLPSSGLLDSMWIICQICLLTILCSVLSLRGTFSKCSEEFVILRLDHSDFHNSMFCKGQSLEHDLWGLVFHFQKEEFCSQRIFYPCILLPWHCPKHWQQLLYSWRTNLSIFLLSIRTLCQVWHANVPQDQDWVEEEKHRLWLILLSWHVCLWIRIVWKDWRFRCGQDQSLQFILWLPCWPLQSSLAISNQWLQLQWQKFSALLFSAHHLFRLQSSNF